MSLRPRVLADLEAAADAIWQRHRARQGDRFHGFVPADLAGAVDALARLRDRATSFVELGSGSGAITVAADLLGYEASGIEIEPWLVEASEELAETFESDARFVTGSFLPTGFRVEGLIDADYAVTSDAAASGWDELGEDVGDFDLVYAFPWPGEEEMFFRLVEEHGRPGQLFLTYHADEGFVLRQDGDVVPLPGR